MDVAGGEDSINLTKLQDICERSMRHAEDSVRSFLGDPLRLTLCGIHSLPSNALSVLSTDVECGSMIGLYSRITGQGNGRVLILVPMPMARRFLRALLGESNDPRPLTEMEQSAIQEIGNIMSSSFLSRMGDLLGRRLLHSVPELYLENARQLVREVQASVLAIGSRTLVVQGLLEDVRERAQGRFFVVSEMAALEPIVHAAIEK